MAVGFPTKANWVSGDILTASQMDDLAGTVNTLANVPPRNAVLNSNFSVWQRGTSIALAASSGISYTADRWCIATGANQATTISRQATSDTTNLPNIQYCARVQRNSGQTGTTNLIFTQALETLNSTQFAGKTVALSFYVRAGANYSATSNIFGVYLYSGTGTDQNPLGTYTGSATVASNATVTLTTTWQRVTITGTVPTNSTELAIQTYFAPTGIAGANDYFEITGVQLELGSTASTYYPNQPTYATELAACQRYFEKSYDQATAPATNTSTGQVGYSGGADTLNYYIYQYSMKVTKRATPTITLYDTTGNSGRVMTYSQGAGGTNNVIATADTIGEASFRVYVNNKASTAGFVFHYTASAEL